MMMMIMMVMMTMSIMMMMMMQFMSINTLLMLIPLIWSRIVFQTCGRKNNIYYIPSHTNNKNAVILFSVTRLRSPYTEWPVLGILEHTCNCPFYTEWFILGILQWGTPSSPVDLMSIWCLVPLFWWPVVTQRVMLSNMTTTSLLSRGFSLVSMLG